MERARTSGYRTQVAERGVAAWRLVAGIFVLAALLGFCALLFRPYLQNWRLQSYVEQLAFDPEQAKQPEGVVTAKVADQAARLGLPVTTEQVKIIKSDTAFYVEARYFVRVDLFIYTVDLHFRPSAGAR